MCNYCLIKSKLNVWFRKWRVGFTSHMSACLAADAIKLSLPTVTGWETNVFKNLLYFPACHEFLDLNLSPSGSLIICSR